MAFGQNPAELAWLGGCVTKEAVNVGAAGGVIAVMLLDADLPSQLKASLVV